MMPHHGSGYIGLHDYSYPGRQGFQRGNWRQSVNRDVARASGPPSGWVGNPRSEAFWLIGANNQFSSMQQPQGGMYPGGYYG